MSRKRRWMLPNILLARDGPRLTTITGVPWQLVSQMLDIGPAMVVPGGNCGSGTRHWWLALAADVLRVLEVNLRQVRDFASSTGTRAKTDSLACRGAGRLGRRRSSLRAPSLRDAESQVLNSLAAS